MIICYHLVKWNYVWFLSNWPHMWGSLLFCQLESTAMQILNYLHVSCYWHLFKCGFLSLFAASEWDSNLNAGDCTIMYASFPNSPLRNAFFTYDLWMCYPFSKCKCLQHSNVHRLHKKCEGQWNLCAHIFHVSFCYQHVLYW